MIGTYVGPYQIRSLLGQGGMGAVYLAEHAVLHTRRAVKTLLPAWRHDRAVAERFLDEARAAARIGHRNVVGVHDVGQLPGGALYIVFDFIAGGTLAQRIDHGGPIAPELAVQLALGVLAGLAAAHAQEVVHRDIKPDNIYLAGDDGDPLRPVIGDFGIAKLSRPGHAALTEIGTVIGTPIYMAPEQLIGAPVGPAADLHAVGVLLYEMLTGGRLPHQGLDEPLDHYVALGAAQLHARHATRAPLDPRRHCATIPGALAQAVLALLAREPASRPASARDAALALARSIPTGTALLRRYAPELLQTGPRHRTLCERPRRRRSAWRDARWLRALPAIAGVTGLATGTLALALAVRAPAPPPPPPRWPAAATCAAALPAHLEETP